MEEVTERVELVLGRIHIFAEHDKRTAAKRNIAGQLDTIVTATRSKLPIFIHFFIPFGLHYVETPVLQVIVFLIGLSCKKQSSALQVRART